MFGTRFILVALLALLMPIPKTASASTFPADRSGGSLGIQLGIGTAGLGGGGLGSLGREGGTVAGLRLGRAINQGTAFEIGSAGWTKSEDGVRFTFNALTAGLAFYPKGGLVLRTGVGLGTTTQWYAGGTSTDKGIGLLGGVGYEFRVSRVVAISPEVNAGFASFSGGSANWIGAGVGVNWYFQE